MTEARHVIQLPDVTDTMRILLRAEDSDGSLGAVEMLMDPGDAGPPLHAHSLHAESFYVLEGDLTVQLGEDRVTGRVGTWASAPAGTPHTLANFSPRPARVLCLFSPGGFERRFQRMLASGAERDALADLAAAERETVLLGPPMSPPSP